MLREGTPVAGARCQALSPQLMQQQAALVAAHSAYLSPMATMAVQMQHMGTVNPNGLIATPLPPSSGRWHPARGRGWGHGMWGDLAMGDTRDGGHQGWGYGGQQGCPGIWDMVGWHQGMGHMGT